MASAIFLSFLCLVVGMALGYLYSHGKTAASLSRLTSERNMYKNAAEQLRQDTHTQLSSLEERYQRQLKDAEDRYQRQLNDLRQQQREQMDRQSALIKEQINSASEEILKKRQEELSSSNSLQLKAILDPLHENLKQMKEAVERSDKEHTISMERLDASIRANMKQAQEVGERADKLAQALTSENKTQGNFGELRLRTLLEQMGLEEGVQFEEQATLRDNTGETVLNSSGHKLIPDVILHFPDDRDVIIDSKMSLKAFNDYFNATTDAEKGDALNRHLISMRTHVKELATKTYSNYLPKGHQKLDFVVMYVFSESALQLALTHDTSLWKWAYDQGVVISGSQNLYMMLRVLELTWRQVKQARNQDEIMKAANEVINRVQMFYERFKQVDEQLDKTQAAFSALKKSTASSGSSIVTAAKHLLAYGAQENPKRKLKLPADDNSEPAERA